MKHCNGETNIAIVFIIIFLVIFMLAFMSLILPILSPAIISINPIVWIVTIVVIIGICIMNSYNNFVSLTQKVNQSERGIDIYLKQRFDLIPNLVETVRGYAKHEENVLEKITELRNEYVNNNNQDVSLSAELNNRYNQLLAVVEAYPELKANESFLNLQKQLSKIESQLQAARRIYNSDVTLYNTKVYSFPSNVIAVVFGFKEAKLFEISENESENINIKI